MSFPPEALTWLHATVNQLIRIAGRRADAQDISRIASKMRYKFHGSPSIVFLNGKEREMIRSLAEHRLDTLRNSITAEKVAVAAVLEVIGK